MNILLDNTFSPKIATILSQLSPEHTITHLRQHFQSNIIDVSWLPVIAMQGDFRILTGDGRIRKKPAEKHQLELTGLPVIFVFNRYTALSLEDQVTWIVNHWDAIVAEFAQMGKGQTRYIGRDGKIQTFEERAQDAAQARKVD